MHGPRQMDEEHLRFEAQDAFDELWEEGRLPFKLKARQLSGNIRQSYRIQLFDIRLPSLMVNWDPAHGSFKDAVKEAAACIGLQQKTSITIVNDDDG